MYNDLDPDNCRYNRITQLQNIQENGALNVLGFDGSIYASHMFSNKNSVYGEIGFRYTPRLKYNLESEAKAVYSGYYPDLYGLTISENGIYDFGSYSIVNSESKLIDSHLFSIGGGLGLSKNINRRFIMQAGIYCSYLMPFSFHRNSVPKSNISANKNELLSLFKFTETTGALVYYLNTGLIYQFYAKK
jgi:hypothetical protein